MSRTIGDRAWPRVLDLKPREPPVETVTRMLPWELQCKASSPVTDLEIRTSPVKVLGRGSDKINISEMGGILRKNRSSILRQFSKHINHRTHIYNSILSDSWWWWDCRRPRHRGVTCWCLACRSGVARRRPGRFSSSSPCWAGRPPCWPPVWRLQP